MVNKWFTLLVIIFVIYTYIKQPPSVQLTPGEKQETHETIDKIKDYVKVLTTSPNDYSLINKKQTLLNDNDVSLENTPKISTLEDEYLPGVSPQPAAPANNVDILHDKMLNMAYNLLHTRPGKALLEKLLLSPDVNPDDRKSDKQPSQYINNSILDVIEGEGKRRAGCGDIVEVNYIIRLVDGQEIENTYKGKKTKTFQLGDRKVIKALEYAVIGMKEGGIRRLIAPPKFAYQDKNFSKNILGNEFVTIDVELIKLKSSLDSKRDNIRIFQESEEENASSMLCSNEVYFTYKLSTAEEQLIATSDKLVHFVLGSSEVPPAINEVFADIKTNSKRIVILPSSLLYNKKINFLPSSVQLPSKGMLLMEIYTFGRTE
jgi:FKBP-type peptidyl-prolyl cis-trans isomerase 2